MIDEGSRIVVIGAGPAGIAASTTFAAFGLKPILLDEGRMPGGQGYRKIDPNLGLDLSSSGHAAYRRMHRLFESSQSKIDYRPETAVWSVDSSSVFLSVKGAVVTEPVGYDRLVLATGATDRIAPIPGWSISGVYSIGGAQVLLKDQGCIIGERVVFYGSSPLLYLAAAQYLEAGAGKVTILDTGRFTDKVRSVPLLARAPDVLWQGMRLLARLRSAGVAIYNGVSDCRILGEDRVEGVSWQSGGRSHAFDCDAVAIGHGLRSETQLAELAGCDLVHDDVSRQWLPRTDADGRARDSVYLAGDGLYIGGAKAAEFSGRLAALACLKDLGFSVSGSQMATLRRKRDAYHTAQKGLALAFPWPREELSALPDETVLCRCEAVSVGTVRNTARRIEGERDVNRVKALTRCGMGRCQARMCGPAAIEIAAAECHEAPHALRHYRAQPPVKPVAIPLAGVEEDRA